jgi:hypothetical protein
MVPDVVVAPVVVDPPEVALELLVPLALALPEVVDGWAVDHPEPLPPEVEEPLPLFAPDTVPLPLLVAVLLPPVVVPEVALLLPVTVAPPEVAVLVTLPVLVDAEQLTLPLTEKQKTYVTLPPVLPTAVAGPPPPALMVPDVVVAPVVVDPPEVALELLVPVEVALPDSVLEPVMEVP